MKTLRHNYSYKFILCCFVVQVFLALVDCKEYCLVLDGQEGNIIEYILFSINSPFFVSLIGVTSVFCIVKCFTKADLLLLLRIHHQKKYFKARLVNCVILAGIWVVFAVAVRCFIGISQKYSMSTTFKYFVEFMQQDEQAMLRMFGLLVIYTFLYLVAMLWIREIIHELTGNHILGNVLPFVFSVLELAIFKSLKYKLILILPLGNVLVNIDDFISHSIYWGFLLYALYYVRIEIMCKTEVRYDEI